MSAVPKWIDFFNAFREEHIAKFGIDIDRAWTTDADTIASKNAIDQKYLAALREYNEKNKTDLKPEEGVLGMAQTTPFTPKESDGGFWGQATRVLQAPAKWTLEGIGSLVGGNNDFKRMAGRLEENERKGSWGAFINSLIEPTQTTGLFAAGTGRNLPEWMKKGTFPAIVDAIGAALYGYPGVMATSGLTSQFNEEDPDSSWTKAAMKGALAYLFGGGGESSASAPGAEGTAFNASEFGGTVAGKNLGAGYNSLSAGSSAAGSSTTNKLASAAGKTALKTGLKALTQPQAPGNPYAIQGRQGEQGQGAPYILSSTQRQQGVQSPMFSFANSPYAQYLALLRAGAYPNQATNARTSALRSILRR